MRNVALAQFAGNVNRLLYSQNMELQSCHGSKNGAWKKGSSITLRKPIVSRSEKNAAQRAALNRACARVKLGQKGATSTYQKRVDWR